MGDDLDLPSTPTIEMDDDEVEGLDIQYDDRPAGSWVISGPLRDMKFPGRRFVTRNQAERWAREKYGDKFIRRIPVGYGRWGFLIRGC